MQLAGGSFGVATEFHYGIYDGPEVWPVCAFVYIENKQDLENFQRAALSGRYNFQLANRTFAGIIVILYC